MGKVKIGIYCYLTADILQKFYRNVPCVVFYQHMNFVQTAEFDGNRKAKFAKKISKIISSEAIRGIKLKLCRNVYNISFYKHYVFYCLCS